MSNPITENKEVLKIRPELIGVPALNQFIAHNSSPRGVMFMGQLAQSLAFIHPEERITLSGIESQLLKTVDMKLLESESEVIGIIPRYRGVTENSIQDIVEYFIMFIDHNSSEISFITIPKFEKNHQHFGYSLEATETMSTMNVGDVLPEGTVLSKPKSVKENDGYAFGTNLNISFMSIKETAEDPVIVSRSALDKMGFKLWETRLIKFGGNNIPLNLYGDEDNYKTFPDIGEKVHDENILMGLRQFDKEDLELLTPSLMSNKSLMEYDSLFDEGVYVRGSEGTVVDIKVFRNNSTNKTVVYDRATEQSMRYADAFKRYREEILSVYEQARKNYPKLGVSPKLHSEMVSVMAHLSEKIKKVSKKDKLEDFQVEITVEYVIKPTLGFKLATLHGSKGIISVIKEDKDMPIDANGERADMIIDLRSITARMNDGNVYEQAINASSRMARHMVLTTLQDMYPGSSPKGIVDTLTKNEIKQLFSIVKEFVSLFGNKQAVVYNNLKDIDAMREILRETIEEELRIVIGIDNPIDFPTIIANISNSKFRPINAPVQITREGDMTYRPIFVGPVYVLLLDKIADIWLGCSSSRLNHFGVPVGTTKVNKHAYPWAYNPTKVLSETETRVIAAYAGPEALAEIKDRALNHDTHSRVYGNILKADNPMQITDVANREEKGFEDDHVISLLHAIYKTSGIDFVYIEENN